MIDAITGFFAKPLVQYGSIALVLLLIAGGVTYVLDSTFNKGSAAGEAKVTDAVQTEVITRTEKARINKEAADAEVRNTPYTDRVDGLR